MESTEYKIKKYINKLNTSVNRNKNLIYSCKIDYYKNMENTNNKIELINKAISKINTADIIYKYILKSLIGYCDYSNKHINYNINNALKENYNGYILKGGTTKEELSKKLEELSLLYNKLHGVIAGHKEITEYHKQVIDLLTELKDLNGKIKEKEEIIDSLQSKLDYVDDKLGETQNIQKFKEAIAAFEEEKRKIVEELSEFREVISILNEKILAKTEEYELCNKKLQDMTSEYNDELDNILLTINESISRINSMEEEDIENIQRINKSINDGRDILTKLSEQSYNEESINKAIEEISKLAI